MTLATSKELLQAARREKYAVGAFNAFNLEMVQGIIEAATEERSPLILQVSQGAIKYAGLQVATELVRIMADQTPVPIVLHLDHGTDFNQVVRCIRSGFTSLMFDGSKYPFDENVAKTKLVAEMGHAVGIPVEGELGKIGGVEDNISVSDLEATMTDPQEAKKFVELTGIDSLAIACGTVHQMKTACAVLDNKRISEIAALVDIPLVLHGASGVPEEGVREAIARGICKINIATHLNQAFTQAVYKAMSENPNEVDPRKTLVFGKNAVKEAVRAKIRLFGSNGKA
jgi:fructose-bisphosphate aldolase class II